MAKHLATIDILRARPELQDLQVDRAPAVVAARKRLAATPDPGNGDVRAATAALEGAEADARQAERDFSAGRVPARAVAAANEKLRVAQRRLDEAKQRFDAAIKARVDAEDAVTTAIAAARREIGTRVCQRIRERAADLDRALGPAADAYQQLEELCLMVEDQFGEVLATGHHYIGPFGNDGRPLLWLGARWRESGLDQRGMDGWRKLLADCGVISR